MSLLHLVSLSDPTDEVTLRAPDFGNEDRLGFNPHTTLGRRVGMSCRWHPSLGLRPGRSEKSVGFPEILADVESHLPAGHPYDDPDQITTVHECTHGINSLLRNQYGCPAFYVLKDRAVLIRTRHHAEVVGRRRPGAALAPGRCLRSVSQADAAVVGIQPDLRVR